MNTLGTLFLSILSPQKKAGDRAEDGRPQGANQDMLNMAKEPAAGKGEVFALSPTPEVKRNAAWLASRLERSKYLRKGEMETETIIITPALAEIMLRHNADNRPVRAGYVQQLAKIMREGGWRLTSQGISFTRDGVLNDGQHRLSAIIASGKSIDCRVTFGEDRTVFQVLDAGRGRSGGDVLHIAGYKYWTHLAAAARIYAGVTSDRPWSTPPLPASELLSIVDVNPGMQDVCADATTAAKKLRTSSAAIITSFYLIKQHSKQPDQLSRFAQKLGDGTELTRRDPILVLRNMLVTKAFENGRRNGSSRPEAIGICSATILAWNRWIAGFPATERGLLWDSTEPFPMPE
jgi:hypothetical protein